MTFDRHIFTLLIAAVLGTTATDAGATAVCERLRATLSRTPVVIGASAEIRKHSSAIARQNLEIRKVRHDLRQMGCGNGSIVTYGNSDQNICVELSDALSRMEANKQTLVQKRLSIGASNADNNPARQRILAAIDANGCNEQPLPTPDPEPAEASAQPLRGMIRQPDIEGNAFDALADQLSQQYPSHGGNLRTLCVRTCDGSFFPISANATPLNFRRDAQMCQQMCPGTETELYYHSILTEESADMVSASTGQPYRSLPTAFSYLSRPTGDKPACGCALSAERQKGQGTQTGKAGGYSAITEIKTKPDPAVTSPAPALTTIPERPYDPTESKVRRVGPMFLPTETSSIDLLNPALPGPQPVQQ